MKKTLKNKKAITLIALVITIVVLVILAAVTIAMTVGNDGLISKAIRAANDYKNSKTKEEQGINDLYGELLVASDGTIQNLTVEKLNELIDNRIKTSDTNPIGTVISIMALSAPDDYLACDGSWYAVDGDYKALAKYIKDEFGSYDYFKLDGETIQANKFKVPDLRGEFLRGTGDNSHETARQSGDSGTFKQGSGAAVGKHQDATQTPSVYNYGTQSGWMVGSNIDNNKANGYPISVDSVAVREAYYGKIEPTYISQTSNSAGAVYTSRPTNTSVLYCIKAK